MTLPGTVVNGVIVLEGNAKLPEGARVWVELEEDDDIGPPPEPYDREKELAAIREGLEDVKAGRTMPFEEFMAKMAKDFNLPSVPPKQQQ